MMRVRCVTRSQQNTLVRADIKKVVTMVTFTLSYVRVFIYLFGFTHFSAKITGENLLPNGVFGLVTLVTFLRQIGIENDVT